MTSDQLTLVLLGAFWAGTSAVLAGVKLTSETRDRITIGKFDNEPITVDHCWRLLLLDWLPTKLALIAVSLVLGIIMVLLPGMTDEKEKSHGFSTVCYIAAIVPFAGVPTFVGTGVYEFFYVRHVIRKRVSEKSIIEHN